MMHHMALVFLGGGVGSVLRYLSVHGLVCVTGSAWAIVLVNVTGSALMGVALAAAERNVFALGHAPMQVLFMTGMLGGFTTFSAFSADVLKFVHNGHLAMAAVYVGASVALSLVAAFAGYYLMNGNHP